MKTVLALLALLVPGHSQRMPSPDEHPEAYYIRHNDGRGRYCTVRLDLGACYVDRLDRSLSIADIVGPRKALSFTSVACFLYCGPLSADELRKALALGLRSHDYCTKGLL